MDFTPLRSKERNLYAWFATRPDLFTRERSPRKTTTWAIIAGVMVVLALIVYLNPDGVVEAFGGRRRGGLAIIGAFAFPPIIFALSIGVIIFGAKRWRVKGGGVLTNPVIHAFGPGFPIDRLLEAVRAGGTDNPGVLQGLAALQKDNGKQFLFTIWSSVADRIMYVGVLRVDGNTIWLDAEPFAVSGERYFDAYKHNLAAMSGRSSIADV